MNKPILLVGGLLAVVTAIVYAVIFSSGPKGLRSPKELAQVALNSSDPKEKYQAALDLERSKEAGRTHLRTVLNDTKDPEIRAVAIRGLQDLKDWYSMPQFIIALNDPSDDVRMMAFGAVSDLIGRTYGYKFDDPPEARARSIKVIQKSYETMNKNPPSHYRSTP